MYEGNWKCSKCGTDITELPFEPDPSKADQLQCRECYRKNRPPRRGGGDGGDRQMYQGNWKCSECGTDITELPFEPDSARLDQLQCRDCHRQNRPSR